MAVKDKQYYEILGLTEQAAEDEIKKAYRKLALHYHPDRNQGDAQAEERFKAISEAYAVLMDKDKRARYDAFRRAGAGPGAEPDAPDFFWNHEALFKDLFANQQARVIFEELSKDFNRLGFRFDDGFYKHVFFGPLGGGREAISGRGMIFGGLFTFGGGRTFGRRGGRQGDSLRFDFSGRTVPGQAGWREVDEARARGGLTGGFGGKLRAFLADALGGVKRSLALAAGKRPGPDLSYDLDVTRDEASHGTRKQLKFKRGDHEEEVLVRVPPGIRPGTRLRLRGKGLEIKGGIPGDLYLRVLVRD